jgi:hypothetical protein
LVAYIDEKLVGPVGLGADGTMAVGLVPAGKLKLRLIWKGLLLRANVTVPEEPIVEVTKNIATAVTLVYPIGNLNVTLTMWDVQYPLYNLSVKLQYVKEGRVVYEEPAKLTDCYGRVTFTQVPIRPLVPGEIRVVAYTTDKTPYIRPQDANLLVANRTVKFEELTVACWNSITVPTWIYSFKVIAVDHMGRVLKGLETDVGVYPVAVLLKDTAYGFFERCCPACPLVPGMPPVPLVQVDFRILNETVKDAVFTYHSQQYYESDPEKDTVGLKPHMFVAGAKYHFMVFHGGVLVYNYTITLPRPYETVTITVEEAGIEHPVAEFKGAKPWTEGGRRAEAELKLVTWVQTLTVSTKTNAGKYDVPSLKVTLIRSDVLNWTLVGGKYEVLSEPAEWAGKWTSYAWSAVGDAKGVAALPVPVWVPGAKPWLTTGIKFGTNVTHVLVLAGSEWGSPGVPDTPDAYTIKVPNATGVEIAHKVRGYIVNWNGTAITILPEEFYPGWNVTTWCGVTKTVRTVAMDGFCVTVLVPPPCPPPTPYEGLPDAPVWAVAIGETGATLKIAEGRTDATGTAKFAPPAAYAYKFDVVTWLGKKVKEAGLPEIDYEISTKQNFEKWLKPYGLTEEKAGLCPEVLSTKIKFSEEYNEFKKCVELRWSAFYVTVEDWSGRPLNNMMVAAYLPGGIVTFDFSGKPGAPGVTRLIVKTEHPYLLKVFWRDSYLLERAGVIPRSIDIYDSFADEMIPRYFASPEFTGTPPSGSVLAFGGTVKTYVYIGLIQLLSKEGKPLSPEALAKITVTITWPDGVVTTSKPGSDGVAPIILNATTVKSWPHPASAAYNPESPMPQSPAGDYKIVVEWAGVGKIAEKTMRIHRARLDVPEVREVVYVDVTDVAITLTTPFNTPMAGAKVTATRLDGSKWSGTADAQGRVVVPEAPLGKVDVVVETWGGMPIGYSKAGVTAGALVAENVGKIVVTVVGARGQGLEGAKVTIKELGITGSTDAAGRFAAEVPAGTYTVIAEKGGRSVSASVTVTGGKVAEQTLRVDIFMTIAGWEMSFSEFVGLLLLIAVLTIVLFIIGHEYAVWRRRRLARAIVPAKPEGGA